MKRFRPTKLLQASNRLQRAASTAITTLAFLVGVSVSTSAFANPPEGNGLGGEKVPAHEEAPGHIIVFRKNVNAHDAANDLKSHHGLKSGRVYQHAIKAVFVPTDLPAQALIALEKNPNIAYVEKNGVGELIAQPIPTGIARVEEPPASKILHPTGNQFPIALFARGRKAPSTPWVNRFFKQNQRQRFQNQ